MPNNEKKSLKDRLQGAVKSTKAAVDGIDLSGVKEKLQTTGESALGAVKKVKLPEVDTTKIKDAFKKKEPKNGEETESSVSSEKKEDDVLTIKAVSTRSAIKIIYYLMAADGQIFHSEEEKFDAIGKELDPNFADNREQIIKECQAQLDKVIDPEDYYDALQDGVEDALLHSRQTADTFITPKLLVWDLLTIAYSDENYDEVERRLLKYVVRKANIDKAVFLEMESSILTLMDIEKELAWIKTTNKPYLTIEAMVNELADRKSVIFESVKDLIAL
ncbi:MAG: TerB family tellurite resistance protein [Clostridiales bacterium]|nr:TerB family tellurite resistance protein [Clostridiales bacterium]